MYALYKFTKSGDELLARYDDVKSEYEIISKYFNSVNKSTGGFRFLGECRGMVYRMNFILTVDGIEDEYMVIHNTN